MGRWETRFTCTKLRASWTIICCVNVVWAAFLWFRRKHDHPALFWFFAVYAISDTTMFVLDRSNGGLGLIGLPLPAWKVVGTALWLSWYANIAVVALTISRGRFRAWWLVCFALPLAFVSCAELLGMDPVARRKLAHWMYEPMVLACGLSALIRYTWPKWRAGKLLLDIKATYLVIAVAITMAMLTMKMLIMLNGSYQVHRDLSHAVFYALMTVTVFIYFALPRFRSWLLRT